MSNYDKLLSSIYKNINNPASFAGIQRLYQEAHAQNRNISKEDVRKWLSTQDAYTLHRQARKKLKLNRIYVSTIDSQWEIDLADLSSLKEYNDDFKFLLTCIDVFSKFAWVEPLLNKSAPTVCKAFSNILSKGRKPWKVRSDKGKEFINKDFQQLLKREHIDFFTSQNDDVKAAIVERFNRSLKSRMWRYFSAKNTYRWIDVLQKLVKNYNHSYHRSIKTEPVNVTFQTEKYVYEALYPEEEKSKIPKLKIGDYVRISKHRHVFMKGYVPLWTEEIFKVVKVLIKKTEPLYRIVDLENEEIEGTFYEQELQKVTYDPNKEYKIEAVLKKRKLSDGSKQLFVKWWGFPDKFNSWINERDLV